MTDFEKCILVAIGGIVLWVWTTLLDRIYRLEHRCDLLEQDVIIALKGRD